MREVINKVPRIFFKPHCATPGSTKMTSVPMTLVCLYQTFSKKLVSTSKNDNIHTRRYLALSKSSATNAICRRRVGDGSSPVYGIFKFNFVAKTNTRCVVLRENIISFPVFTIRG